jgi:hypothetical protein
MPVSGSTYYVDVAIPIAEWSNANYIVGSFQDVPTVPGAGARIDMFSVSYGTTNATTVCSASPCSYLDQIGTAVTSVTRVGIGDYSINTSKTYLKLKCTAGFQGSDFGTSAPIRCENCSSIQLKTGDTAGSFQNSFGTLQCQGTY